MSFLHPWGLAIAGLAVIPILLHLFRHRTRRRVEFPALRYLDRTLREQARTVRFRDLVLLLVRVSAIILLALAAAAPLAGRGDAGDHGPTDVAVVVDNSASTSLVSADQTVFQASLEWARAAIAEAGPDDRFWIIPAVGGAVTIAADRNEAGMALDRITQTHGAGALLQAMRSAALSLPAEPGRAREIQVLTDGQATGFDGEAGAMDSGIPVVVGMPVGEARGNAALVAAEPAPGTLVTAGVTPELTARVRRFEPTGAEPVGDSAQIRFEVNGETLDIATSAWDREALFRMPSATPGLLGGKVEIEPDGLRVDDTRHFAIRVLQAPDVERIVSPYGFLAQALDALAQVGRIGGAGEGGQPLVMYEADSGQPLPDPLPGRVAAVLLVPPSDPLALPRFNQRLMTLSSGWKLTVETATGSIRLADANQTPGLAAVSVSLRYGVEGATGSLAQGAATGDTVLIRTVDGRPWLVRGERDGRILLLLASPLTPEATTMPISPAMIPFIEAVALRWSRARGWPGSDFEAGAGLSLPATADSIRLTDGSVRRVDGGAPFTPELAGLYTLFQGDGDSALFAVNPPASESDLTRLDPADLEALLGGVVVVSTDRDEWRHAIFADRRGRDLTPWLIMAAAALLLTEVFVASPGRASRRAVRKAATG